jgi:hypothetical protein
MDPQPHISGTGVPTNGALYRMLSELFERAPTECKVGIVFAPAADGNPDNPVRDELLAHSRGPSVETGRVIAGRLQSVTTHRSGLGLLFLLVGAIGNKHCLVVARFPADEGVVAQEDAGDLSVEFIERVFMKNTRAYKSAIFAAATFEAGFNEGLAVDRQLSSGPRELSEYWIAEFLISNLRTTPALGTRRLATALRDAVKGTANIAVKGELVSAAVLLRNQDGRTRSARRMIRNLGLSAEATTAIEEAFPRSGLIDEQFRFDATEFQRHVLYRVDELDNGALLMAEEGMFTEVFQRRPLAAENRVRYTTEGRLIDQRFRKTK